MLLGHHDRQAPSFEQRLTVDLKGANKNNHGIGQAVVDLSNVVVASWAWTPGKCCMLQVRICHLYYELTVTSSRKW